MPVSTFIVETHLRVRYAETDAMGVAHHSAYVAWLEMGRVDWLRAVGGSYRELEGEGYALPVVDLRIRYVAPARFDDALVVRTALGDLRSREAQFVYEVVTDEPRPRQVANGMTRHICLQSGAVALMPESLRQAVAQVESAPDSAPSHDIVDE
jgi:acyl-CoA thioester hydrolase